MTASIILFLVLDLLICDNQSDNQELKAFRKINYDLSNPDRILVLPRSLHEISGVTEIDASSVACVQDEHGVLFIYDILKNQIRKQFYFSYDGDYEGIARVDQAIYVLRSDGALFGIINFESPGFKRVSYITGIPSKNNEGLCYDQKNNRLLIAAKDNIGKDKDKRAIYGFDLNSKKLNKEPIFEFDLSLLERFALENKIKVPMSSNKKGEKKPDIKLRTSAIAIHPLTNRLYVLSAIEPMLFVFDMNGNIEFMEKLNPDHCNQPEGLTFLKNGDMLISNEGQNKAPTLVRFNNKSIKVN